MNSKTALIFAAGLAGTLGSQAALLLYEPFNYTSGTTSGPTSNGYELGGQSGGLGMTGNWSAFTNSSSPITVYSGASQSGVNLNNTGPVLLDYDGSVSNLQTSGGYVGMGGSNNTDHMVMTRTLASTVTDTFVDGTTTWFSFVSVRGYVANPSGIKLALGYSGLTEDRGHNSLGEAIGGGGGLGSSVRNGYKVYPQFWDATTESPGETVGTFTNYDITGMQNGTGSSVTALSAPWAAAGYGATPSGQSEGLQSMLLDYGGVAVQPNGARNIIVGRIEWHDGAPDVIAMVTFTEGDTLSEGAFNALITAQPGLSSSSWTTQPDLDQSKFDTLSLAGGKWFVDEVRLATTFGEAVPFIPEPSAMLLSLLGLGACLRRRRN